jgi:hypothetical protein
MKKISIVLLLLLFLTACGHQQYSPEDSGSANALSTPRVESKLTPVESQPTSEVPLTKPEPDFIEAFVNQGYTKDNPLTDPEDMIKLFTALEELQYSNFDKPGWYHMTCGEKEIVWLHFSEPETRVFDQSMWLRDYPFYKKINVASILLKDGTFGPTKFSSHEMEDYKFEKTPEINKNVLDWESNVPPEESHLKNMDWFVYGMPFGNFEPSKRRLRGEEGYVDVLYPETSRYKFEFKAWTEAYQGQTVLVIQTLEDPLGNFAINTRTGGFIDYSLKTEYFAVSDGRRLYKLDTGADVDGTVHEPYDFYPPCPGPISYYENLPSDIQALYDEAEARLIDFHNKH